MLISNAPRDPFLYGGHAGAKFDLRADLLQSHFECADRNQHIERAEKAHVPDAHQFTLHLILPALNRNAKTIAQELHQLAAIETLRQQDSGDPGRWIVGQEQLQSESERGFASRL